MGEIERVAEGAQNLFRVPLFRQCGESRHRAEWVAGMFPEFARASQVQVRIRGYHWDVNTRVSGAVENLKALNIN